MACHVLRERERVRPPLVRLRSRPLRIGLVGNPNVGKSVVFTRLTGRYATVSNYPGTTVAITQGRALVGAEVCEVIDTPGVNALAGDISEDEAITRAVLDSNRADLVVQVAEQVGAASGGLSLGEAPVVVSGGRGVGSAEGFAPLEELAGLLGGVVGCSRAVTMAGWRPHTDQVGQTGTKISPDLYITAGISGATQHLAGCKGAKRLLAINQDRDAPIMASADYAVIGDLAEIVPAITAEIRRARG
jgi:electron transfer flavoprotein alpha subunit